MACHWICTCRLVNTIKLRAEIARILFFQICGSTDTMVSKLYLDKRSYWRALFLSGVELILSVASADKMINTTDRDLNERGST